MSITVSNSAAKRVQIFINERGKGLGLRLGVKNYGCSGMAYTLEFVDQINNNDLFFEDNGIKVFVDKKNLIYLNGTNIDLKKNGLNESFIFNNPNISSECGCGKSFHIE